MTDLNESRLEFWNSRAALGTAAGTNDVPLKSLEIQHITRFLGGCRRVLDAGCGNGVTAVSVLREVPGAEVFGFDYAEAMVQEAARLAEQEGLSDRLTVQVGNLMSPPFPRDSFDAVYTERALINLSSVEEQATAIAALAEKVRQHGRVILCESFQDGLDELNAFRAPIGLPAIEHPWHNRYLRLAELPGMLPASVDVETISNFSSTYYFLSRVVNAWLAQHDGVEPSYDAPVNRLAFSLPSLELCAQTKIVVLKKR